MIKRISLAMFLAWGMVLFAQETDEKQDWFHQNHEETGVYGVGTDAAITFLKSKKIKPQTIIVGVLDSGVDVEHEDLAANIWVNKGEKAGNGKDDDKNGYVDDINGWDFIGGKNGDVNQDTYEATRIVKDYMNIFDSGEKEKDLANIRKMPKEYQMYLAARKHWANEYFSAKNQGNPMDNPQVQETMKIFSGIAGVLGENTLTEENLNNITPTNEEEEQYLVFAQNILANYPDFEGKTGKEIIEIVKEQIGGFEGGENDKLKYYYNTDFNPRTIVGDDYRNMKDRNYGNNEVEGPDAFHGTHVSGIIAAVRNNGIGIDGIAGDVAKIMVVRNVPDGDERDKDVANGIRYAVDNGAKIINMSFGKGFSPDKEAVWEAIKYADKKGVLMFHAAGNDDKNLDLEPNFPTNFMPDSYETMAENWITIGASTRYNDRLKASFSNYGKARVDIFSPGLEIYSTIPNNEYRYAQGTSMASPAAAGCAALLWAYFPHLTSLQVKEILMKSANVAPSEVVAGEEEYETTFDQLSLSGGVIDVYKAVKLAYEKYNK